MSVQDEVVEALLDDLIGSVDVRIHFRRQCVQGGQDTARFLDTLDDGCAESLSDVFGDCGGDAHALGGILSTADQDALTAFLETL